MICEMLTRGAMCSEAYRGGEAPLFFKKLGIPLGLPVGRCTEAEQAAAWVVDRLLIPYFEGREVRVSDDVLAALEALSLGLVPLEAELSAYIPEDPVAVYASPCVFGLGLRKNIVVTGPPSVVRRLEAFLKPRREFVIFDEGGDEAVVKYGVEAAVGCLAKPPLPVKSYVITCLEHQWIGDLLARALGLEPAREGAQVQLRNAGLLISHPKKKYSR